jgi:hypothetical protein
MAPGKKSSALHIYRTPLTGFETHKSGFEVTQQRIFEKKVGIFGQTDRETGLSNFLFRPFPKRRRQSIIAD